MESREEAGSARADEGAGNESGDSARTDAGTDEAGWGASARERVGRGFDRGKEAFGAFKEALEETFTDARERGDLTTDRARELWGRAVDRARDATSDARDRFDFATRAEFEALERRIAALELLLGVEPPEPPAETTEAAGGDVDPPANPSGASGAPSPEPGDPGTTD